MLDRYRYFLVNIPNANMIQIYDVIIGQSQQRSRLDEAQMIVKIEAVYDSNNELIDNVPGILNSATEINHATADTLMGTVEWNDPTP